MVETARDSFNFLTHADFGPGMAQVLIDNGYWLEKFIGSLKGIAPTDDEIKKFESLQTSLVTTQQEATKAGRAIVVELTPMIEGATKAITDFVKENEVAWKGDAVAGVRSFADGLSEVRDVAQSIAYWLNKIVDGENWLATHGLGAAGALANRFGPQQPGNGEATPIPWGQWLGGATRWLENNWGIRDARGDTLDDELGPGNSGPHPAAGPISDRKGSGPHPAPGLAVEGKAVSRGNPMPVTLVHSETAGAGSCSWLFGGSSPTSPQAAADGGGSGRGSSGGGLSRVRQSL